MIEIYIVSCQETTASIKMHDQEQERTERLIVFRGKTKHLP